MPFSTWACRRRWISRSAAWTWRRRTRPRCEIAQQVRALPGVSDVLVPQDVDYPALKLDIDRVRASELGLNAKEVVGSVITALTSDGMIAPSYWVDPKTGNDYFLTVQYPENYVKNLADLASHAAARRRSSAKPTRLDTVSQISPFNAPTEVDHYQLRRVMDVYVAPTGEDLSRVLSGVQKIIHETQLPENVRVDGARLGAGHAGLLPELRPRADSGDAAGLSDPGGAVRILPGPVADSAGGADRA